MQTLDTLFLPGVSGNFLPDDRVPAMVVVPYGAKQVLQELVEAAARLQHPNLTYTLFSRVATGARLLCTLEDLQQECPPGGLDVGTYGLNSPWEGDDVWVDGSGQRYVPYLLSDPDREPDVVIWNDGLILLRWDAVDSSEGLQPLESDFFRVAELGQA